jgi:hypothetical protein
MVGRGGRRIAGTGGAAATGWHARAEATSGPRAAGESGEIERVRGKSAAALGLLPTKQSLPSARSRASAKIFLIKKYTLSSAQDPHSVETSLSSVH